MLNEQLFDFQKYCVETALRKGKFALFEDCGLGKSIQQLDWAKNVCNHTKQPEIIVAPLAVVGQTIQEGVKFGYVVNEIKGDGEETLFRHLTLLPKSTSAKIINIGVKTQGNISMSKRELYLAILHYLLFIGLRRYGYTFRKKTYHPYNSQNVLA